MPRGDRTGPDGFGSRTGRGLGYCSGYNSPGFTRGTPRGGGFFGGRGRNFGQGRGFGFQRNLSPQTVYDPLTLTKEEQKKILQEDKKELEEELKRIDDKLKELK